MAAAELVNVEFYEKTLAPRIVDMQSGLAVAPKSLVGEFNDVKTATTAQFSATSTLQETLALVALIVGAAFAVLIGRSIARPVGCMTAAMRKLASGDASVEIPARDGTDEIAEMGKGGRNLQTESDQERGACRRETGGAGQAGRAAEGDREPYPRFRTRHAASA